MLIRLQELLMPADAASGADGPVDATLTLPFDRRCRSRLRARLDDGREVAVMLPRGSRLRDGARLRADDGTLVHVRAAEEHLSEVTTSDMLLFGRLCYHLGNRHLALEVDAGRVRYQHDHVLDELAKGLGLAVRAVLAPFEPEGGAYANAVTAPGHGHDHGHADGHGHAHAHGHAHDDDSHHHDLDEGDEHERRRHLSGARSVTETHPLPTADSGSADTTPVSANAQSRGRK